MASPQSSIASLVPSSQHMTITEQMAQLGTQAVFRARRAATQPYILQHMERRTRIVLILLDGTRTVQQVARLTHRSELEVARVLVQLLKRGYIEFLSP